MEEQKDTLAIKTVKRLIIGGIVFGAFVVFVYGIILFFRETPEVVGNALLVIYIAFAFGYCLDAIYGITEKY